SALGRIARLASSALSWLVALGSLGIAYAEYRNAQTAQARERITHMALSAETRAAEQALGDVVRAAASAGAGADKLERGLSRRPAREVASLEHEVRANPTDVQARRDLLVRRALGQ
ncbi:MAG TPA: hypothetical protein PKC49_15200, partial [Phycisphaerae bacterium]|nr:hypothetical protein [Phycisphaerae bacterium]